MSEIRYTPAEARWARQLAAIERAAFPTADISDLLVEEDVDLQVAAPRLLRRGEGAPPLELPHRSSLRSRRSSRRSFSIPSPGAPFTARPGPMNSFTNFFRSGATLRRSGRELEGAKPPRRRSHDAGERQGPNNAQNLPSAGSHGAGSGRHCRPQPVSALPRNSTPAHQRHLRGASAPSARRRCKAKVCCRTTTANFWDARRRTLWNLVEGCDPGTHSHSPQQRQGLRNKFDRETHL